MNQAIYPTIATIQMLVASQTIRAEKMGNSTAARMLESRPKEASPKSHGPYREARRVLILWPGKSWRLLTQINSDPIVAVANSAITTATPIEGPEGVPLNQYESVKNRSIAVGINTSRAARRAPDYSYGQRA